MQTPPDRHTDQHIQAVAFGLVQLTDMGTAAQELERLYGRTRVEAALLPLVGRHSATVIDLAVDGVATSPSTGADAAANAPRLAVHVPAPPGRLSLQLAGRHPAPTGAGARRGTRPADWL